MTTWDETLERYYGQENYLLCLSQQAVADGIKIDDVEHWADIYFTDVDAPHDLRPKLVEQFRAMVADELELRK